MIDPFSRLTMIVKTIMVVICIYVFFKDAFSIAILPVDKRVESALYNLAQDYVMLYFYYLLSTVFLQVSVIY